MSLFNNDLIAYPSGRKKMSADTKKATNADWSSIDRPGFITEPSSWRGSGVLSYENMTFVPSSQGSMTVGGRAAIMQRNCKHLDTPSSTNEHLISGMSWRNYSGVAKTHHDVHNIQGKGLATRHVPALSPLDLIEPAEWKHPDDAKALGAVKSKHLPRSMARIHHPDRSMSAWDRQVEEWLSPSKK